MKNIFKFLVILIVGFIPFLSRAQISDFTATSLSVSSDNYSGGIGQGIQILGYNTSSGCTVGIAPISVLPNIGGLFSTLVTASHGQGLGYTGGQANARLLFNLAANSGDCLLVYPGVYNTVTYSTHVFADSGTFNNISLRAWVTGTPYSNFPYYAGSTPTLTFTITQACTILVSTQMTSLAQYGLTPIQSMTTVITNHNIGAVIGNEGSSVLALTPGTYTITMGSTSGSYSGEALVSVTVL